MIDFNSGSFKDLVEKDINSQKTVSFNFPKYEEVGTPHDIWHANVAKVEGDLESIIEKNPLNEEFPLMHIRREESDENGRVIRVHLDLFGRSTLVSFAMELLNTSVNAYVSLNMLASDKGKEVADKIIQTMPAELQNLIKNKVSGSAVEVVPLSELGVSPEEINTPEGKAIVESKLKEILQSKGYDAEKITMVNAPENSLTNLAANSVPTGPLDFAGANEVDEAAAKGNFPFILMPNPNPDEEH